ncbi:MAG TPA: AAA family ATPase [Anaerolineales bacterium]|nr:AAA family ATPase [Anaerolineales bacterium]
MGIEEDQGPRLLILGSPQLVVNGKTVRPDTRKALALLTYLGLSEQEYQRDSLTALLWPELTQSRARAALRRTLTPLNNALGPEALNATRETVALNPSFSLWVDVCAFEQTADQIAAHGHEPRSVCDRCFAPLAAAIALYRGDFLEGFSLRDSAPFDDWQFYESERLRRQLSTFLELLSAGLENRGELDAALLHARRWLSLDSLHEPAHRAMMRIYARQRDRSRALRQYRECLRILDQELGVSPLEETTRLYEDILENRFEGAAPHPAGPLPQVEGPRIYPEATVPFIGRRPVLERLTAEYKAAQRSGRFVVLEGEIGIGKTRTLNEFIGYAQGLGAATFIAQCYEGEKNLAYAPIQSALRTALNQPGSPNLRVLLPAVWRAELARLLPEIGHPPTHLPGLPSGEDPNVAQSRLFEAVRQALIASSSPASPALLVLDDLQWADSATIDLLAYLIRRLDPLHAVLLVSWRTENIPTDHPLRRLSSEGIRSGTGSVIRLDRMSRDEVDELASHFTNASTRVRKDLFERTEGLPFYVVEYLTAGFDADQAIPSGVREIQKSRLSSLEETSRQLIATAAVIGRSFDFETLKIASGRGEEETIRALEDLLARGLLIEKAGDDPRPTGPQGRIRPRYDFTHQTIHQIVYEQTSLARRRLLHRRVAEALMAPGVSDPDRAGRIAHHLHLTGMEREAAVYYRQAGDHARSVFANQEALQHFETALALGAEEPDEIQEALGDLLTLRGEYRAAVRAYERSAALGPAGRLPFRERKLAIVHHRRGDYDLAGSHFRSAVEMLSEEHKDSEIHALIHIDWSRTAAQVGDLPASEKLARTGLRSAVRTGNRLVESQALNILGILSRKKGAGKTARKHLEKALDSAGDSLPARIAATNNLALVRADEGDYDGSVRLTHAALADCIRLGDRHREAALRNHLADRLHATGDQAAAMEQLKLAVEIFAEIGTDAGDLQPEIWKLTEW